MTILTVGDYAGLPTNYIFSFRGPAPVTSGGVLETTPNLYVLGLNDYTNKFHGSDLTYDDAGRLTGGVVTGWEAQGPGYAYGDFADVPPNAKIFSIAGFSIPATTLEAWMNSTDTFNAGPVLFSGDDSVSGGAKDDGLFGYGGDNTINGRADDDWVVGGSGIQQDPLRPQIHILIDPPCPGAAACAPSPRRRARQLARSVWSGGLLRRRGHARALGGYDDGYRQPARLLDLLSSGVAGHADRRRTRGHVGDWAGRSNCLRGFPSARAAAASHPPQLRTPDALPCREPGHDMDFGPFSAPGFAPEGGGRAAPHPGA